MKYYKVDGVTGTGGGEFTGAKNQPPIANFTYTPENPVVNQAITFNASSSYDPDGNITNYKWEFGDGNITTITEPNKTWNATATWEGYVSDWHNISFEKTVVLLANKTYNYTILNLLMRMEGNTTIGFQL